MQQVGIHGEWGFFAALHFDGNLVLCTVVHQFVAGVQIPLAPGSNHFNTWLEGIGTQFKTHLVVTFAGGAMGNGIGAGFIGDLYQTLGNKWAGDRGAEQVLAFINSIGAEHGEYIVAGVLFSQVVDINLFNT